MTRLFALSFIAFLCVLPVCGGGSGSAGETRVPPVDGRWDLSKGYDIEFRGILTATTGDHFPIKLEVQAEVWAEASATVLDRTGPLARLRLVLKDRELTLSSPIQAVQRHLERAFVLPAKGASAELWFDVRTGRLDSLRYDGKRYDCHPVDAEFISLIAFPYLHYLVRPLPARNINLFGFLGDTRAVMTARGPDPRGTIITNAIRFESEDGRGARGTMTAWQAFRLSPGRVFAAWGRADFDTRTSFPSSVHRGVLPIAWHIEYLCQYSSH